MGGGPMGPYVTNPRGPTSRFELAIDWDYPVHEEKIQGESDRSQSVGLRRALPLAEAFAEIAKGDRRPLLVLRECRTCNGTDDALMTRKADNERTMLMLRWFHCVKLPPDVMDEDHPYHGLFGDANYGHLFLARWDGTARADLNGQQSRTELWALIEERLAGEYEKKVDGSLKQLLKTLDRFDQLDTRIQSVKDEIDEVIEKEGASQKLGKLQNQLAEMEDAKNKARAEAVKLSELELKAAKDAKPAAGRGVLVPKKS